MKKLTMMILCVVLVSYAMGGDNELERLRGSYNAAVVRATAPLKASYEKELQRLLQRYTQANKINEAAEVMAELQRMNTNSTISSAFSASKSDDPFFVGPTWYTPLGTKFTFKRNFTGIQQREGGRPVPLKWTKTNDCVEIDTVDYQDKPCKWSFRFVSVDEAYFRGPNDKTEVRLRKGE